MKTISLKRILVILAAFFTALLLLITPTVQARAEETSDIRYTDVLEDLKRDKKFDETKYVPKADDYSLSVIHIAENKARELLIYVYRPSAGNEKYDCKAKKISLSKTVGDDVDYSSYNLTLVDNSGVFDKYKVENFTTEAKSIRYYSISMISRKGYRDIDGSGNSIGSIIQSTLGFRSYKVGQFWKVATVEGNILYECDIEEVVIIEKKLVGHFYYSDGIPMFTDEVDTISHFVAFSTDYKIDELRSAKVFFKTCTEISTCKISPWSVSYSSKILSETEKENEVTLNYDEYGKHKADGWFGKDYKWKRIQKSSDFLSDSNVENLNLNNGTVADLEQTEWVLLFFEDVHKRTSEWYENLINHYEFTGLVVSDVAILQLTFITDGVEYTMGVVDDYATPDDVPDGVADTKTDDFKEWLKEEFSNFWDKSKTALKIIVVILCLVLLGVLIVPFLPFIFQLLGTLVKWLLKVSWWIIAFPWNLIGQLFKKKNKKNDDKK